MAGFVSLQEPVPGFVIILSDINTGIIHAAEVKSCSGMAEAGGNLIVAEGSRQIFNAPAPGKVFFSDFIEKIFVILKRKRYSIWADVRLGKAGKEQTDFLHKGLLSQQVKEAGRAGVS